MPNFANEANRQAAYRRRLRRERLGLAGIIGFILTAFAIVIAFYVLIFVVLWKLANNL